MALEFNHLESNLSTLAHLRQHQPQLETYLWHVKIISRAGVARGSYMTITKISRGVSGRDSGFPVYHLQ